MHTIGPKKEDPQQNIQTNDSGSIFTSPGQKHQIGEIFKKLNPFQCCFGGNDTDDFVFEKKDFSDLSGLQRIQNSESSIISVINRVTTSVNQFFKFHLSGELPPVSEIVSPPYSERLMEEMEKRMEEAKMNWVEDEAIKLVDALDKVIVDEPYFQEGLKELDRLIREYKGGFNTPDNPDTQVLKNILGELNKFFEKDNIKPLYWNEGKKKKNIDNLTFIKKYFIHEMIKYSKDSIKPLLSDMAQVDLHLHYVDSPDSDTEQNRFLKKHNLEKKADTRLEDFLDSVLEIDSGGSPVYVGAFNCLLSFCTMNPVVHTCRQDEGKK